MQPLNHLRRAITGCEQSLYGMGCYTHPYERSAREVLSKCQAAIKFVLPENGRIFNDSLRGLPEDFRLPFDLVLIEYKVFNKGGVVARAFGNETTHAANERIILAQQDGDSIFVASVINMKMPGGMSHWYVQPFGAELMPAKNCDPFDMARATSEVEKMTGSGGKAIESVGIHLYDLGGGARKAFGSDWQRHAHLNLTDEISAVLELIEALSCSNVQHEALPVRKSNKSAEKRGALPFDEYRVLTVRSTIAAPGGIPTVLPFDRRAVREHLRRGHIRRLQDGRRVWVNASVVNAGASGVVSKSYRMAA